MHQKDENRKEKGHSHSAQSKSLKTGSSNAQLKTQGNNRSSRTLFNKKLLWE